MFSNELDEILCHRCTRTL